MKHPIRDRVVIILSSIILLALAVIGLLLITGYAGKFTNINIGNFSWLTDLSLPVRLAVAIGLALLLVMTVMNFIIIFPARKKKDLTYTVQHAENGELKISLAAISHLVNKCIDQHPELSDVESKITSNEDSVTVELHVTLSTDINIPMAVTALQKEIKQYVEATSGVHVDEIRVVVDSTAQLVDRTSSSPFIIPERLQAPDAQEYKVSTPPPADDAHMYTLQEEPAAHKPFTPPVPPVNAYGDTRQREEWQETLEDDAHETKETGTPDNADADAHLSEDGSAQQEDPKTDVWMMGASPLPSESEEEDEA